MIFALAGRRVDASDAKKPRFPLRNVERVSKAVHSLLVQQGATAMVSSAACGADLIGLSEGGKLGLRRRVVLPFSRTQFRRTSVVDRPGEWGSVYDTVLDEVDALGDLIILGNIGNADPYSLTSRCILDEASALGQEQHESIGAVMVWDGATRGQEDYTTGFGIDARRRGLPVFEIRTV
jgi:hypothetical protein